jgi:alkylation response protein AidB-like acyl-CoA dehydrogenase
MSDHSQPWEPPAMNFAFTPEQDMLRDSVRSYLADKVPMSRVRELMESDPGYDPEVWAEMAAMGWQGMAIPEAYGGSGYSYLELGILLEEMGRALTPVPFFSSVVLGAGIVLLAGSDEQKAMILPGVVSGERLMALAAIEPDAPGNPATPATVARSQDDTVRIDGTKAFVVDGHIADTLVVSARNDEGGADLYVVDANTEGVVRRIVETMDMTRKQAEVTFTGVTVPVSARLGDPGSGVVTLERLADLAATALAFEQVGGGQRCLEMSVEYAKERRQFGRPIGSFQAIKHKCADMLVEIESARSAAYYAGWAASEDPEELLIVAPLAKSYCSEAYFSAAAETIQVHGGIGFTWEHDAHLYFKRAKSDELMFGTPAAWRAVLADRLAL